MFKIFQLEVRGIQPYKEAQRFKFSPFFTLIRGGNGAGKTTVLESLALLGHCCVMKETDVNGKRYDIDTNKRKVYVHYTIVLGKRHFDHLADNPDMRDLAEKWDDLLKGKSDEAITLNIQIFLLDDKDLRPDLKEDLKNERRLETEWAIAGDDKSQVEFVRKLIEFSRPKLISSERQRLGEEVDEILVSEKQGIIDEKYDGAVGKTIKLIEGTVSQRLSLKRHKYEETIQRLLESQTNFIVSPKERSRACEKIVELIENNISQADTAEFSSTPRSEILKNGYPGLSYDRVGNMGTVQSLPPLVCYFNTDMYHYGIGLDIRESPKHLSAELAQLVEDRLGLVKYEEKDREYKRDGRIANFEMIQEFWQKVYEELTEETLMAIKFDEGEAAIAVADPKLGETDPRGFLSSGENQTLSLGLVFGALQPKHSIVMLDEPDLHLSLPAGIRMYNEIFKRSLLDDIQVIAVSHLPFVFPNSLHPEYQIENTVNFTAFYRNELANLHPSQKRPFNCVTLYYLSKRKNEKGEVKIDVKIQKKAAKEAGEFQNQEIEAILRQSLAPTPTIGMICLQHIYEFLVYLADKEPVKLPRLLMRGICRLSEKIKKKLEI